MAIVLNHLQEFLVRHPICDYIMDIGQRTVGHQCGNAEFAAVRHEKYLVGFADCYFFVRIFR